MANGNKPKNKKNAVPQLEPQRPNLTAPSTAPVGFGPKYEGNAQAQQFANLSKLYRQTFNTPIQNTRRQLTNTTRRADENYDGNPLVDHGPVGTIAGWMGGGSERGVSDKETRLSKLIGQLKTRKDNTLPTLRRTTAYAGTEGIDPTVANAALEQYLTQEQALARFMPRNYRAPGKVDLINAIHTMAPQIEQERYNTQAQDEWMQMASIMQQVMLQDAELEYQQTMDKAGLIKDPDKQAQVMSLANTVYGLKQMQADALAAQQNTSQGKNSIASFLAAAQAGNTANTNKLYGGADTTQEVSGTQAYDDDFVQQLLAGQ